MSGFNFFNYPFHNGFLEFTLGIMFVLSLFHFLLFFQHRDKLYLLYSGYTFFIILSQLQFVKQGFLRQLIEPIWFITFYGETFTETYYIIYTFLAFKFLDLKKFLPEWHSWGMKAVKVIIIYCFLKLLVYTISANEQIMNQGYLIFTGMMSVLAIVLYYPFFKVKSKIKYYLIIGSLFLFLMSVTSLLIYYSLQANNKDTEPSFSILYIGFIIENILFALGLGHKQKLILKERDHSQAKLIVQLQENEILRKKVHEQMKKDIEILNRQAEIEKLKIIQLQNDKDIAELKVSSLRSQMNPHFIFNSLNSIKHYIIENDTQHAVYYLNKFSKLIRKILASSMEKESSLAEELETMNLYVNIENIRFNNAIHFITETDENLNMQNVKIPTFILQPFLENAIWHGLSLKEGEKTLKLSVEKNNCSHIQINIIDNGVGFNRSKNIKKEKILSKHSVGINLCEERLMHFSRNFKNDYALTFTNLRGEAYGTHVTILLPVV
ncbi:MAG: histidine kinase [Chitinophagaceae bacterium]